jgi:hypothetical protein
MASRPSSVPTRPESAAQAALNLARLAKRVASAVGEGAMSVYFMRRYLATI